MYGGVNIPSKMMHEYQLCMDTTNLKINDNNKTAIPADQVQIEPDRITSINPYSTQDNYNSNEFYSADSPVLITNLDQTIQTTNKIKTENENMNRDTHSPERNSSNVSTKICKVCGDKSLGYNFSQVTCESCKAFFRRNALRKKNFKCPFTDNCEIDVVTRRFCQKCRLRKCFAIGMKSEWILSDEEKRMKRLKIEENKKKRRNKQASVSYVPTSYIMNNYLNGSIPSNNVSPSLPPSALVPTPMNTLNPIVYDSQIDDSNNNGFMRQSPKAYNDRTVNYSINQDRQPQHIQQPEIVNQLVHSHYEQYKTNVDYDPMANMDNMSPQYSMSLNSNQGVSVDQFFSDSTNSPLTFNNSTQNSSIDSPMNILNLTSGSQILNGSYSPSDNNNNMNCIELANIPRHIPPPPTISKFMTIDCLPDAQMLDFVFEQAISSKLRPNDPTNLATENSLSDNEIDLINELIYATSNVGCVMSALTTGEPIPPENVIFELLRMTDYAVRKSVKVAKKLSFFRGLCEEDQISALKGSSTEMMLCRTISMYDEATDMIIKHEIVGTPKIRLDLLKGIREEIYFEHKEMILSFKKELRQDTTLVSILMAILLFQPDRPHIQHRTAMKYIQTTYRFLLKRYIYVNFCKENVPIFESLIQSLSKLRTLNEKYIKAYVQLNADIIGPLLMEVFDFGC